MLAKARSILIAELALAEQVNEDIERDKILSAAEGVEYGLIDDVLTSRKASLERD